MSKKLYFNCAPNGIGHGSNFGMQTVDFAIHNILKSLKNNDKILLTSPWSAYSDDSQMLKLKARDNSLQNLLYGLSQFEDLSAGDAVFLLGRFSWGADYQVQSAYGLKKIFLKKQDSNDDLKFKKIIENRFLLKDLFKKKSETIEIFRTALLCFKIVFMISWIKNILITCNG